MMVNILTGTCFAQINDTMVFERVKLPKNSKGLLTTALVKLPLKHFKVPSAAFQAINTQWFWTQLSPRKRHKSSRSLYQLTLESFYFKSGFMSLPTLPAANVVHLAHIQFLGKLPLYMNHFAIKGINPFLILTILRICVHVAVYLYI